LFNHKRCKLALGHALNEVRRSSCHG
jgi:hypothetical protein